MSKDQVAEQTAIVAKFDQNTDKSKQVYRFKKDKLGNKRANVELEIPVPSVEGIVSILSNGGKELDLLQEVITDFLRARVGEWVAETPDASQETFPLNKFSWEAIANLPKQDRRTVSITEEQWTGFAEDYKKVMSQATKKTSEQLDNAIKVYMAKFAMFKSDKQTLNALKSQLAVYMENTESGDDHSEVLDVLLRRLENYLSADDPAALAAAL